jgi:putative transcriptional regulator
MWRWAEAESYLEHGGAKASIPSDVESVREATERALARRAKRETAPFAAVFGFTVNQIRDWEQGRCRPIGGARAYLMLIDTDPKRIMKLLRSAGQRVHKAAAA